MPQSHFDGKRLKRKKERALTKATHHLEIAAARMTTAMKAMSDAVNSASVAIANFYKPLLEVEPRNWRHKKKLMNRDWGKSDEN